jgi:hypothetical protein
MKSGWGVSAGAGGAYAEGVAKEPTGEIATFRKPSDERTRKAYVES